MHPIYLAAVDKTRPVLVLTREAMVPRLSGITVAPITSTVRGLTTEVRVGAANGLDHECAINCDAISTIKAHQLGRFVGYLLPEQERALAAAVAHAFDLDLM